MKLSGFLLNLFIASSLGATPYGYVSYSTLNVGDDIQSIAAQQLLPKCTIAIDREQISQTNEQANIILNGWYMITQDNDSLNGSLPNKSWPPAPTLNPLLISMHFTPSFFPQLFSDAGVDYLKKYGPVGARDLYTYRELQQRGIPCYFSGCLTLTLKNSEAVREDLIYAVDLDATLVEYIKSHTSFQVIELTHLMEPEIAKDQQKRRAYASDLLKRYARARCVITSRLHAALPCLAYQTPVLLVNIQPDQFRFEGLKELVNNCSREQLLTGQSEYDLNQPPPNPSNYKKLRKKLLGAIKQWVEKNA